MLARPLVLAGSVFALVIVAGACSSFSSDDAPVDGGAEASNDAPLSADSADTDGATTGDGGEGGPSATPTVLGMGFVELSAIVATETTVYIADRQPGRVIAIALAGGAPTIIADTGKAPSSLVIGGSDLFWADFGNNTISRQALAGGATTTKTPTPGKAPVALAAAQDRIVIAALGAAAVGEIQQYMFDLTTAGPAVGGQANSFDVAVYGADIFWTESSTGVIKKGQTGTGGSSDVALAEVDCQSIAVDGAGLYWTRPTEGLVRAIFKPGTTPVTIASNQATPLSLAADASGVYWMTADGTIRRSNHDELPPFTVAKGFNGAFDNHYNQAIALTSKYVVWITNDGKVLRVDK